MRRNYNKQNRQQPPSLIQRTASHPHFHPSQNKTLAELNHSSSRQKPQILNPSHPLRVQLPDYFNVPKFIDFDLFALHSKNEGGVFKLRSDADFKRKLKDLDILAEGMRRAKNIKQESRYYFTQGVLQHNNGLYSDSIASFEKFLKIVLFIRDQKSVELALNAIGAEYMCLGQHEKALQYHKKQREINQRADVFMSRINTGLCYQMSGDVDSALIEYQQAQKIVKGDAQDNRRIFVKRLMGRIASQKNQMFITAEEGENVRQSLDQSVMPVMKVKVKKSKIDFAIRSAEQHMDRYLSSMKNSFVLEKE